ncbi:Synaptotagmin-6 [Varanus komodoensis]|nr:Synaptotagmin-6 [Varanus komodoensis]
MQPPKSVSKIQRLGLNKFSISVESVDLGEIMFSLCYLPTAGRLTLTVIKCRNLKAMDITGYSDPYVKVSLLCDGRRLKKKKTTIKRNTLNPTYNEAIIFDIPPENMDQVSLLISVMDYDRPLPSPDTDSDATVSPGLDEKERVGHNEIIGVCRVANNAEGLGRDHWNEMLAYPRKPIAHWHPLVEVKKSFNEQNPAPGLNVPKAVIPVAEPSHSLSSVMLSHSKYSKWHGRAASFDSQGSCPSPKPPQTP